MEEPSSPSRPGRPWLRVIAASAILLVAAYLLAGYYLAPRVIRAQASGWAKSTLHKPLTLGEIRFDPLHITLDIDHIALGEPARPMVALDHLRLRFAPLSVFQGAWRLKELTLDHPFIDAIIRRDGTLNLAELIPPSTGAKGPPTAIRIDRLSIIGGRIAFVDHSRALQPHAELTPVSFVLQDFQSTGSRGGQFTLAATSEAGEHLAWRGDLSMAPLGSRGDFSVANLRADTVYRFLSSQLPVALTSGTASVAGHYAVNYGAAGLRAEVGLAKLALADIGVRGEALFRGDVHLDGLTLAGAQLHMGGKALSVAAHGLDLRGARLSGPAMAGGRAIRLADARLDQASVDLATRRVDLGALNLTGLDVPLRRDARGAVDLLGLLPATHPAPAPAAQGPVWGVHLAQFALADGAVHGEDHAVRPVARLDATGITLAASDLGTDLTRPVPLNLSARINHHARLTAQGTITPANGAGQIRLALGGLPLSVLLPYLPAYPALDPRGGVLGASGLITLPANRPAALRFAGQASLDGFALYEKGIPAPLAAWSKLALTGLHYDPQGLTIASAHLTAPVGRIAVMADKTFNFSALVPPTAQPAATSTAPAFPIRLRELRLEGGTLDFADHSITPNFEARIDALTGSIRNIANRPGAIAAIDLHGQVIDRYAPVTVQGTIDAFHYDEATDIALAFHNIELPIFNPYSGTYAGYAIAKGKLSTDFTYHIAHRSLQAQHHVIIDQLEWGQPSATKARVSWPVRLATALLKDRNGVIRLDVPVNGTLDDPTFRLAPIIWHIIGNVIEKAVTAPFRLIGSLFAGAEKAQFVDFAPGSAQLPSGASEGLAALGKGLAERPGLNLDIPVGAGLPSDAAAMADAQIATALMAKEARKGLTTPLSALKPGEQHDRLQALYRQHFHKSPDFTALPPAAKGAEGKAQRLAAETQWLRVQLRGVYAPSAKDLNALGAARGAAIREGLMAQGGIDPMRLFLSTATPAQDQDGQVRLELKLR